ncbi:MAG: YfhO family protein [Ignavibacterium sp.]|nr:MAG: YfhO family protein [Ignavibacterium sp.]
MVKKQKKAKQTKREKESFLSTFSFDDYVPNKYQILILAIIICVVFLIFFYPLYFGGKTFQSGDIITSRSMKPYVENHTGDYTLWNPYVFGGMPAYALATGYKWFNVIYVVNNVLRDVFSSPFVIDYAKWTFYLFVLAFTTFFFMRSFTKNNLISLMTALATSFSTGIVVFLYIGHVTKLTTLYMYPLIFLMLFRLQNKIGLVDFLLLIVIFNLAVLGWHVQIIFYTLFAIGIYFIYYFLRSLKQKDKRLRSQIFKSAVVVFFTIIIAVLIQSDNLTQIYEYSPYSTRGTESILEKEATPTEQSESDFYQYATNWSFSPGEVLTFIIPSYYGFGKSIYRGPLSQNQPVEVNTYFGQMPFVDVAMYMGVIVFFFALFSMVVNWKDSVVRFLTILTAIALLISFGRTFPPLYDLMFYYFPFFDKFRVPSMILVLVQISIPILAGLGVAKIISLKNNPDARTEKIIKNATFAFAGLFVISLLLASPIKEWFIGRITDAGQKGSRLQPLYDYMADMFITDTRLAFFFSVAVFGMAYAFVKRKLSADLFVIAIAVLIVIDLFRIDHRGETYTEYAQLEQLFIKPDYIQAIENTRDNSIYRVLNLKRDGSVGSLSQNSNLLAYYLMYDIYGYSGIKPRAIQDYYDVLGSPANPTFWRMLNVKYIVFDQAVNFAGLELIYSGTNSFVYLNKQALPRAYFVKGIEKRKGLEILNAVKDNAFDPKDIAFVENDLAGIEAPDSTAFVNIVKYDDETIELDVNSSGNNFLFLSDTYMPAGWKAYIDGEETKVYRANHNFRGIIVPSGKHKVEFIYLPDSFVITKYLALSLSSITLLGLIIAVIIGYREKKLTSKENGSTR